MTLITAAKEIIGLPAHYNKVFHVRNSGGTLTVISLIELCLDQHVTFSPSFFHRRPTQLGNTDLILYRRGWKS